MSSDNDVLRAENDELKSANDELKSANDALKAENDELKAENYIRYYVEFECDLDKVEKKITNIVEQQKRYNTIKTVLSDKKWLGISLKQNLILEEILKIGAIRSDHVDWITDLIEAIIDPSEFQNIPLTIRNQYVPTELTGEVDINWFGPSGLLRNIDLTDRDIDELMSWCNNTRSVLNIGRDCYRATIVIQSIWRGYQLRKNIKDIVICLKSLPIFRRRIYITLSYTGINICISHGRISDIDWNRCGLKSYNKGEYISTTKIQDISLFSDKVQDISARKIQYAWGNYYCRKMMSIYLSYIRSLLEFRSIDLQTICIKSDCSDIFNISHGGKYGMRLSYINFPMVTGPRDEWEISSDYIGEFTRPIKDYDGIFIPFLKIYVIKDMDGIYWCPDKVNKVWMMMDDHYLRDHEINCDIIKYLEFYSDITSGYHFEIS
jgi:hypothetical protein